MAGSWSNTATSLIVLVEQISGYSGIFGYSPAPGLGNLVFSLAAAAGVDPFGNVYQAGLTMYSDAGADTINLNDAIGSWTSSDGSDITLAVGPGGSVMSLTPQDIGNNWLAATVRTVLGAASRGGLRLSSPADSTNTEHATIELYGGGPTTNDRTIFSLADRWVHTGAFFADNIQSGSFSITPTVASQWTANTAITFPTAFDLTPVVMVTPSANGPGTGSTTELEFQTTGVTTTGFNCRIRRDNLTATTLSWLAVSTQ